MRLDSCEYDRCTAVDLSIRPMMTAVVAQLQDVNGHRDSGSVQPLRLTATTSENQLMILDDNSDDVEVIKM